MRPESEAKGEAATPRADAGGGPAAARGPLSYRALLAALAALVGALFLGSLLIGPAPLPPGEALWALVFGAPPTRAGAGGEAMTAIVMREIRLPRAALGLMIGVTLGLSGAALQGYLRNPLADPGVLGISASASLGAVLAIHTGLAAAAALALPLAALVGAFTAVMLLHALAGARGGALTLILAGVALSSLAAAAASLVLNLSPNPFAAVEIVYWMLGSLEDRSLTHLALAAPFMLVGWAMLGGLGRALDALTLGEDAAASLGVRLGRVRLLATVGTAASVGAATAVAGAIGFVGLVAPHLMRPLVGAQPSRLLPASALCGAALLLAADIAVRLLAEGRDLKLGVLTALVGAPFFFWLVLETRRTAP